MVACETSNVYRHARCLINDNQKQQPCDLCAWTLNRLGCLTYPNIFTIYVPHRGYITMVLAIPAIHAFFGGTCKRDVSLWSSTGSLA